MGTNIKILLVLTIQLFELQGEDTTKNIINFLTNNGTIDKSMLFEPPFTDFHQDGLIGLFDDPGATKIISIVDRVNRNAEVG